MRDDENAAALNGLTRMAALFGRDALLPVVEGLRHELRQALVMPGAADAHRIAGLAGTLGFAAVSASWQAVDQGSEDRAAALSESRTALTAINDWLQQKA